jgi:ribosomal protein S15P/S13E
MALTTEQKKDILKKHATTTKDTGSAQVQVGQRRRMLNYLERKDADAYKKLIGELGIRK